MRNDTTTLLLALAGVGLWLYFQRPQAAAYTGTRIATDTGWNYPPIYPDVTGSPAVDPIATWPGWIGTPPYAPWPGMTEPNLIAY